MPISGIGTVSRALGLPLMLAWLYKTTRNSSIRLPVGFHGAAGLFVGWCACSIFWTVDPDISTRQILTFIQLYILCFILWTELATEKKCLLFVQAYVLGAVIVAGFIFYNNYFGNVTRWDRRATIAGVDENDIALILSTAVPMAWMLAITKVPYAGAAERSQLLIRIVNLLYIPAGVIAMIMTGSRGGFASLIPTCLYILYSLPNISLRRRITMIPFFIAAIVAIQNLAPSQPLTRITTTLEHLSSKNVSGRWEIWEQGLQAWYTTDFSTIFGIGIGGHYFSVGRSAHSTPISILVETGAIGLLLLALILYTIIRSSFKYSFSTNKRYVAFTITLLSVWFIGVLALSWEYRKPTWVIWSLLVALSYASSSTQEENQ